MSSVLDMRDLSVSFATPAGLVRAVDGVSLAIEQGETLGLIGESGSGKSVLGMAIMRLLPRIARVSGTLRLGDVDLLSLDEAAYRRLRGGTIGLVPQNPGSSLNPTRRVGAQIGEVLRLHRGARGDKARTLSEGLLARMGFASPARVARRYPHELSGGMRQRVLTAIGIAGSPRLLIADEPTKGLDAVIRGQVIETLRAARQETGAAMLVITHDLRLAERLCDRLAVMYAGQFVEWRAAKELFAAPLHPYTQALLAAMPSRGLVPLAGAAPGLEDRPTGCLFAPRCPVASKDCQAAPIAAAAIAGGGVRCVRHAA